MSPARRSESSGAAIVTGAASGIGYLFTRECLRLGLPVLLVDLDAEALARALEKLRGEGFGDRIAAHAGDVARPETMEEAARLALERWARLDLVVNNAGVSADGEFDDLPPEEFDRVVDVNLRGVVNGCRASLPFFRRQGGGKIINVSSLAGLIPGGLMTAYGASKWAVTGFSLGLRAEAAGRGIQVTCFCPGFVETPIHDRTKKWSPYLEVPENQRRVGSFPPAEACLPAIRRMLVSAPALVVAPRSQAFFWWLFRAFPAALPLMWSIIIGRLRRNSASTG